MKVLLAFLVNALFNFAIGLIVARFLGPEEYGRFALALALTVVVQTAVFDWIRLAAIRFYSERSRADTPEVRATLDVSFALLAGALVIISAFVLLSGASFALSHALVGLALAATVANGLFDYSTGLVRARFHDGLYSRLVIIKNALSLALTAGGAFLFASAKMALLGGIISLAGSVVTVRKALNDHDAQPRSANWPLVRKFLGYAAPIVLANLLYLLIPFVNRALVTKFFGFAETGQFSLAYDLGLRAIQAIGSALDVLLFQIAVAAHEQHGEARGRAQIARNFTIVIAVLLPAAMGLWLILPSIETLVVPPEFRGPFAHYLTLLLPGLFALALVNFAVNPIFQLQKKTLPLVVAALVGCAGSPLLMLVLPRGDDASNLAIAQSVAYCAALVALIGFAAFSNPQWPSLGDLASIAIATGAMSASVLPLRSWEPGWLTLAAQLFAAVSAYAALTALFNTAGLRTLAVERLRPMLMRS